MGELDFETAELNVSLTSGTVGATSMNNNGDIVVKVGKGSLSFNNAVDDKITVTDSKGKSTVINAERKKLVNDKDKQTVTKTKGNWHLVNSGNNSTINAGKGDDSLWGSNNYADTFLYSNGDGHDVIFGFEDDALLKITGKFSATYDSSKDEVSFTLGKGSITLRDFTATTFRVNDVTYKISKNKFVKQ